MHGDRNQAVLIRSCNFLEKRARTFQNNYVAIRNRVTKSLEHQIREECGQACANPKCREWSTSTHELHHIDGDRSRTVKENLVLLCANCHSKEQTGVISQADVMLWKRMAEANYLPPPKGQPPTRGQIIEKNYGIVGEKVHIEKVEIPRERKGPRAPMPGLIEADADMKTYATYLVKKYIEWRIKGQEIDRRRFSPASAHGILCEGFGSSSAHLIPQARFFDWVFQAQAKIDNTAWGKINKRRVGRNYHTWEEHLGQRGKA